MFRSGPAERWSGPALGDEATGYRSRRDRIASYRSLYLAFTSQCIDLPRENPASAHELSYTVFYIT